MRQSIHAGQAQSELWITAVERIHSSTENVPLVVVHLTIQFLIQFKCSPPNLPLLNLFPNVVNIQTNTSGLAFIFIPYTRISCTLSQKDDLLPHDQKSEVGVDCLSPFPGYRTGRCRREPRTERLGPQYSVSQTIVCQLIISECSQMNFHTLIAAGKVNQVSIVWRHSFHIARALTTWVIP